LNFQCLNAILRVRRNLVKQIFTMVKTW